MTKLVVLLRAVNLGPTNRVGMAELKEMATGLGLTEPETLLASGNLVCGPGKLAKKSAAEIEAALEAATKKRFGVTTDFFVRDAGEWQAAIASNPFPAMAKADPSHLVLVCTKKPVPAAAVKALTAAIAKYGGREEARAQGTFAYLTYPDGIGRSKLSATLIDKTFGCAGTGRNWNTVLKLAAKA